MGGDGAKVAYPLFQEEDGGPNPTSPLQLNIYEISVERAIELNKQWHSRVPIVIESNIIRMPDRICFGAEYKGKIYACAIWTSPIARAFNHKNYLELRRMAISAEAPKNTASRMIAIMTKLIKKKLPHIVKLLSYQDTEVHLGTIYRASGWYNVHISHDPNGWVRKPKKRTKRTPQTCSPKIRWEKDLR